MTRKHVKFVWTEECQKAFDEIKTKLSNPPILRMPDMVGMFRLMSDTSIHAAGAALYQGSGFYIVGYNSKKLPSAAQNYSVTELELFGLVVNICAFRQLLTNVYFEVFCDHSAIAQILNGKKKLPTRRIQRPIEHLLPFNFSVQYLPGEKMHIADILSRLAGKDLEAPNDLIPISFNVMTRTKRTPTQQIKLFTADKLKSSQLPPSYIPPKPIRVADPQQKVIRQQNIPQKSPTQTRSHPTVPSLKQKQTQPTLQHKTSFAPKQPAMPIGILRNLPVSSLPQEQVRKSLVNPNLQIPKTLPPLELPPPEKRETIDTYRPPDESLFRKPLPVLKDSKELDVFTRHIPNSDIEIKSNKIL